MASHLSAIGFAVATKDEFAELAQRAARMGNRIAAPQGVYARWAPGNGVELWAQLAPPKGPRLIGCNPHFQGTSRIQMGLTRVIHESKVHTLLDGSFYGWANPRPGMQDGDYPFVVDVPDFDSAQHGLKAGTLIDLQVAAFAYELETHPSDAAYERRQHEKHGKGAVFAPESFIPSGTFRPGGELIEPPRAEAIFAGHIANAHLLTNPVSSRRFHHIVVDTLGGSFDVVADPVTLQGEPVVGGVASGTFWLSGRITGTQEGEPPPTEKRRRWFSR